MFGRFLFLSVNLLANCMSSFSMGSRNAKNAGSRGLLNF